MVKIVINNKEKGFGSFDEKKNLITINRKRHKGNKSELLDTVVHEKVHARHRKMKEQTVRRVTAKMIAGMSPEQKRQHLAKLRMKSIDTKLTKLKKKYKMSQSESKPGDIINHASDDFKSGVQVLI